MDPIAEVKREIRERIRLALGVTLGTDEQHFFTEAGVDSLAFLNIVQWLEKKYEIRFVNDSLPELVTCNLLAAKVMELSAQGRAR